MSESCWTPHPWSGPFTLSRTYSTARCALCSAESWPAPLHPRWCSTSLAQRGVRFTEIAGNATIVVSLLAPRSFTRDPDEGTTLFSVDLLTDPQRQRLVLQAPVASLHALL